MVIDPATAAYGVFQVAFATLDTRVSRSLAALCQCRNANLTLAILKRMPFGTRLAKLREAAGTALTDDPDVQELSAACDLAEKVQKWRNRRIHAEVRFAEDSPVLTDPNGTPLRIDPAECAQKIREAIRAGIAMETAVPHLVAYLQDIEAFGEPSDPRR